MSFLDDEENQKLFSVFAVIVFFLACTYMTYCCVRRRRTPVGQKLWVVLKQPQVGFCTLVTNRDPYYRVIEEYSDKYEVLETPKNDMKEEEKSLLLPNRNEVRKSGRRSQKETVDSCPQYPTTEAYPQYQEEKQSSRSHQV